MAIDIRSFLLDNISEIRDLLISDRQADIINEIRNNCYTSHMSAYGISLVFNISVNAEKL
jgi:hypothetical protein